MHADAPFNVPCAEAPARWWTCRLQQPVVFRNRLREWSSPLHVEIAAFHFFNFCLSSWLWLKDADHWSSPHIISTTLWGTCNDIGTVSSASWLMNSWTPVRNLRVLLWCAAGGWKNQALPERRRVDVQGHCNLRPNNQISVWHGPSSILQHFES